MEVIGKHPLRQALHRPLESYPRWWIGTAVLVAAALLIGVTVYLNSLHLGEDTYTADFAQASGVGVGDNITDAGIPVGTVAAVRLAGDHVTVTMKIRHGIELGSDSGAAIKLTTLLGSRYVELRPAGTGTPPGHAISLSHTEVTYDLPTALQNAATTFSRIDANRVGAAMSTLAGQLHNTPALVPQVLTDMKTLSSIIAQRRSQIGELISGTDQLGSTLTQQQTQLGAMVVQGRDLVAQIISRQQAIEGLLNSTTTLVHQLEPIAVGDRPEIDRLLANLTSITGMISRHDNLLRNILQILPVPWRLFANATGTGEEMVGNAPDGAFLDPFMCALSTRARQMHLTPYFRDCK